MSESQNLARQLVADKAMVVDYLSAHPDFFATQGDLLARLHIPHDSGEAVSLIERQIGVFRKKCARLEKQLKELLEVARENERIGQLLHQFAVSLMRTETRAAVLDLTRETALRDFHAEQIAIHLCDGETAVDEIFANMSMTLGVVCGELPRRQCELLFEDAPAVASVALISLCAEGDNIGALALGSGDRKRFHPSKGILFLSQLGSLVSHRLLTVRTSDH